MNFTFFFQKKEKTMTFLAISALSVYFSYLIIVPIFDNCVTIGCQNLCDIDDSRVYIWTFGSYFRNVTSSPIRIAASCLVAVLNVYNVLFDQTNNFLMPVFGSILVYIVGIEVKFYLKSSKDLTFDQVNIDNSFFSPNQGL
jgi:hypothetical protein